MSIYKSYRYLIESADIDSINNMVDDLESKIKETGIKALNDESVKINRAMINIPYSFGSLDQINNRLEKIIADNITLKEDDDTLYDAYRLLQYNSPTRKRIKAEMERREKEQLDSATPAEIKEEHKLVYDILKSWPKNFSADFVVKQVALGDAHYLEIVSDKANIYFNEVVSAVEKNKKAEIVDKKSLLKDCIKTALNKEIDDEADESAITVYIRDTQDKEDYGVGLLYNINNKSFEPFEMDDEASPNTVALYNWFINGGKPKPTRLYGAHTYNIIEQIKNTGVIPKGMFMSPKKEYASGYVDLEGKRGLFSCVADANDFSQHTEYDWMAITDVSITNFKYLS